jgi:hypothetical protein
MDNMVDKIVKALTEMIINPIIYLLIALSVMYFIWGLVIFLIKSDDASGKKEGTQHMMWGLIGLFIITSVWGILNLINSSLDFLK